MSALDTILVLALIAAGIAAFVLADRRNQRTSRENAIRRAREIASFQQGRSDDQGAAS